MVHQVIQDHLAYLAYWVPPELQDRKDFQDRKVLLVLLDSPASVVTQGSWVLRDQQALLDQMDFLDVKDQTVHQAYLEQQDSQEVQV